MIERLSTASLLLFTDVLIRVFFADLPVVLPMLPRIYLPQGMPGRLDCPVDANPPATRIVWSLNEQIIDIDQVQRVKVSKYGALLIKSVLKEDEGRYTCRPYSPLGSGQISVPVQVLVRGKFTYSSFFCCKVVFTFYVIRGKLTCWTKWFRSCHVVVGCDVA